MAWRGQPVKGRGTAADAVLVTVELMHHRGVNKFDVDVSSGSRGTMLYLGGRSKGGVWGK